MMTCSAWCRIAICHRKLGLSKNRSFTFYLSIADKAELNNKKGSEVQQVMLAEPHCEITEVPFERICYDK
jgi:hypothetical protein